MVTIVYPSENEDRYFTTVITPWGRYRYKTATQGYIASGDGYTRRFDEIVADVPHRTKCVDDTLLWSDDIEESFVQAYFKYQATKPQGKNTLRYKFKMMHAQGAKHRAADAVTRNPTGNNSEELKLIDDIASTTEDSNQFDYLCFLSSIMKDDCWDVCSDEEL
ncbi:Hypothetical predicted protein [Mytilus galloprovincialis]|uniref:Uncharacterized protein n=1 Tax=Mytilus galloprovincialis TaxID=29158 RepID=A0A8B6EU17_MYTGA|nr:Hypothetical predicted protein [Mytilus galloprovincialis]